MLNYKRYKRVPVVNFPERTWPNKEGSCMVQR
jgi:2-isopropylmalate synthase